jgi:uncharacterized membrane protein (UPF0127 family)
MRAIAARLLSAAVLLLCLTSIVRADEPNADLDQLFPKSELKIATPDARLHRFQVWIAEDEPHRERGLMFVKSMPEDAGMLFAYPSPRPVSMWMKNTVLPLDMLFVNTDGKVEKVVENTQPFSLAHIDSEAPIVAVIELNAGTCSRLHIRAGARVLHALFGNDTEGVRNAER